MSGPNLDADRMDYLLRDAYFTGVASGRYDADQLVASLRLFERDGASRGRHRRARRRRARIVRGGALHDVASVYFHHTTRMFERILQDVLRELWPDPRALDPIDEFLRWDDFRVLNELRESRERAGPRAARARSHLRACRRVQRRSATCDALRGVRRSACARRFGDDAVWADEQSQVMHRLPLGADQGRHTVWVGTRVGARRCARGLRSDRQTQRQGLLAQTLRARAISADVREARRICAEIIEKYPT